MQIRLPPRETLARSSNVPMAEELEISVGGVQYLLIPSQENFLHNVTIENDFLALVLVYTTSPGQVITKSALHRFRSEVLDQDDVFRAEFFSNIVFFGAKEKDLRVERGALNEFDDDHVKSQTFVAGDAFSDIAPGPTETAACVQTLIDAGAIIVGKVKLMAMIMREEPLECVEFTAPFNPRADGYQVPSGSSHGSAAGISSYDWLDFSVGSDTNGSGRKPASYNGCFSIRPTTGIMNVDGVVAFFPQFDMPVFFGRDISRFTDFISVWYGDSPMLRPPSQTRFKIVYPRDYLPTPNPQQSLLIENFVTGLESALGIKRVPLSIAELWRREVPDGEEYDDVAAYLETAGIYPFYYDQYHNLADFRNEYQEKFGKPPDVAKSVSKEERDECLRRCEVYRDWLLKRVFKADDENCITIMPLPIEVGKPNYRDSKLPPESLLPGFSALHMSPIMRAPEVTAPVTKREEPLPIAVSVIGAPDSDGRQSGSNFTPASHEYIGAYPRPDWANLVNFLASHEAQVGHAQSAHAQSESSLETFALLHDIKTGSITKFSASEAGLEEFTAHRPPSSSSLLFLRGFASPAWLIRTKEIYEASEDFYRCHLDFAAFRTSGSRDFYTVPSLPSSHAHVFQLKIPTIFTRTVVPFSHEPEDLETARRQEWDAMKKYFQSFRRKARVSDSMVRKWLILSKRTCVLEQNSGLTLAKNSQRVFRDLGVQDQEKISGKPFSIQSSYRKLLIFPAPVKTYLFRADISSSRATKQIGASNPAFIVKSSTRKAAQNICHLPFEYGAHLNRELASRDVMYALSELLHFAASAEIQFLNVLQKYMNHELSFVGAPEIAHGHSISLLNLRYIKMQLSSHSQSLAEVASLLRNRSSLDWPLVTKDEDYGLATIADKTATLQLQDFEYLLQRAVMLSHECDQGMATLANSSALEESRRHASMAVKVQRLTIIGTIFIPLSFACSVWGMNVAELGSGPKSISMWFATAGPVLFISYVIYKWDTIVYYWNRRATGRKAEVGPA
ncbi:hypothetical protein CSUB01_09360 [Colletotrichum sublineola]|uniref:Amidase domain-containing protein n=1 Tax=Colletotrichum sublineola TaxID=1173701 RepID=A0A066XJ38_COLSU|nr:hypothetical protein CSUB01_09360 [Colletotrichum sublineola]